MMTGEFHSYQEAEEDPFEAEETLSLSDLPITGGDSTQSDDSYSKYDDDDDFFEFFSEDFTAATRSTTVEKEIIFCGRIINNAYGGESKKNDAKKSNSLMKKVNSYNTSRSDPKSGLPRDYSVGMMRSETTKNRWYLFMFGMSSMKSPPEMELRDIKSRQIRRSLPATASFPAPAGGEVVVRKGQKKWLGKLLRSLGLGCGNSSKQQNDVVKSLVPWDY